MTEQEIERCLERFTIGKATDVINFDYAGTFAYIQRLKAENAELKSSLTHANEECLKWHERAQNLLKDSGESISGYEKKISDLQAENAELRHRAEVTEWALLTACVNLIKDKEDNVNMELLAHVVYTKFLRKAEKELAVEKKDAN